jgi:hypothetical protein
MRLILIGCASVALMLMSGCNLEPSGFPLSIATVQKMDSGSIEFEEQHGKIVVRVVDKFCDCHIHVLNHDGMTKERAVTILRVKQQELKDKKPEPTSAGDVANRAAPEK